MKASTIKSIYFTLGIIALFVIWYLAYLIVNNSGIIPSLSEVFDALGNIATSIESYEMIAFTILKIILSIVISFIASVILAILSLINFRIEAFIRPLIAFLRTVPVVSIAMIVLIVFFDKDIRYLGTIVISSSVIVPIIYEGILTGFKTINTNITDATKLLSKVNLKVILSVYIPLALPNIITSLVQSFGLGLKVLVMSEVIVNPPDSIGRLIGEYASYGEISYVFAWTIILIIIVLILDIILKKIKIKSWE